MLIKWVIKLIISFEKKQQQQQLVDLNEIYTFKHLRINRLVEYIYLIGIYALDLYLMDL